MFKKSQEYSNCVVFHWLTINHKKNKIPCSLYFYCKEFKNLNIDRDNEILIICASGTRSQIASELLTNENFNCSNISDGFLGSKEGAGWKKNGLPSL